MEKPSFITDIDFKLLQSMYPNKMDEIINKLNNNYPVQYLIGYVDFYGYNINVDERALIPRFETELLVQETIELIKLKNIEPKILEIGTGSGCIAIALSKELNTNVTSIDISKPALDLAASNAVLNNADIKLINADIKNCDILGKYNVIISNPPYVGEDEIVDAQIKYEPRNAIFAQENGLEFYKTIIKRSKEFTTSKNLIAFEIGYQQANEIKDLAIQYYPKSKIMIKQDLTSKDRYLFIIND